MTKTTRKRSERVFETSDEVLTNTPAPKRKRKAKRNGAPKTISLDAKLDAFDVENEDYVAESDLGENKSSNGVSNTPQRKRKQRNEEPTRSSPRLREKEEAKKAQEWKEKHKTNQTGSIEEKVVVEVYPDEDFANQKFEEPVDDDDDEINIPFEQFIPDEENPFSLHKLESLPDFGKEFRIKEWPPTMKQIKNYARQFYFGQRLNVDDLVRLLNMAKDVFSNESNIVNHKMGNPVFVVGDLHGQFHDMYHIFVKHGWPSATNVYVFNGDLVDRGPFGIEIVAILFMLKIQGHDCVHINRGNHETYKMSFFYGFLKEIFAKYGKADFDLKGYSMADIVNELIDNFYDDDAQESDSSESELMAMLKEEGLNDGEDEIYDEEDDDYSPEDPCNSIPEKSVEMDLAKVFEDADAKNSVLMDDLENMEYIVDSEGNTMPITYSIDEEEEREDMSELFIFEALLQTHPEVIFSGEEFSVTLVIYKIFGEAFQQLPIATCLSESVFIVHGGLCRKNFSFSTINKMNRAIEPDHPKMLSDYLWSDPHDDYGFSKNSPRGDAGILFGTDVTANFLKKNKLSLLIRSHQNVPSGFQPTHEGKCITIFSAPNYCNTGEKASVLKIAMDFSYTVYQFDQHLPPYENSLKDNSQ